MKIRFNYVSNSSSSSFVVVLWENDKSMEIPEEKEELLYVYGFRYVKDWRKALRGGVERFCNLDEFRPSDDVALHFEVSCNGEEVEEMLFENRIPFVEAESYGTAVVQYDGVHDYYDRFLNLGSEFLMYGFDDDRKRRSVGRKAFTRHRISDGEEIEMEKPDFEKRQWMK
jgi:hypothetical protein